MKHLIKKMMILFMWYPLRLMVKYLPLKLTYLMAVAGGRLLYMISRDKQRIMADEFRKIMPSEPDAVIVKAVKDAFVNYCVSEVEVLLYPSLNREFIDRIISFEGLEHLDKALEQGRGVLLFQAHFGAFQMTMPAIGYRGYVMNQISASAAIWKDGADSKAQQKMFDIKAEHEYALPVKHISVTASLRPLFNALKAGEIVGITVDGGGGKKIVPIRFLGRDSNFQTGAADIALSTGAEIIPAFITTENGIRHRLILHPPIKLDPGTGKEANRLKILMEFSSLLEGYVYKYPAHYGYTLCLRRMRAGMDASPFFNDYGASVDRKNNKSGWKVTDYV